jgi:prolipoprotein diacylglyceryl transferase
MLLSIPSPGSDSLSIFGLELRFYGLMIALGVLAAVEITRRRHAARGGDPDDWSSIAMWAVPAGLVGARLYHVITDWRRFEGDWLEVFNIRAGGLGIPGGVLLGTLVGLWAAKRRGLRLPVALDEAAPAIPVAQAIGRLGNWFNQELFGGPSDLPWAVEIDPAHRPDEYLDVETFHPTFLYEGLWNLLLALLIVRIDRTKKVRPGKLFAIYIGGYGLGRLWVEAMRIDPATELFGVRVNIWMSLVLVAFGVGVFLWGGWRRRPTDSDWPYVDGPEPAADDDADDADDAADAEAGEGGPGPDSASPEAGPDGVTEGGPTLEGPGSEVAVGEADDDQVDLGVDPEEGP